MKPLSATALALVVGATIAFTATGAYGAAPRVQLQNFACQRALDPPDRSVSVSAVMRPLPGTQKLEMQFSLLERAGGSATSQTVVRAGDLGVWISPKDPKLGQQAGDVWELSKPVLDLDAPASYRFRVAFRWIGAHSNVIGTALRLSRSCNQRELRPDLLVKSLSVSSIPGRPLKDLYTSVIANRGATGAGPFEVLFTPGDDSAPKTRTIAFLGPGQAIRQTFVGPVCDAASPPTVTADAATQVDDYNRANNTLTAACPAATAPEPTPARR
jgi:hypothetical protein